MSIRDELALSPRDPRYTIEGYAFVLESLQPGAESQAEGHLQGERARQRAAKKALPKPSPSSRAPRPAATSASPTSGWGFACSDRWPPSSSISGESTDV